VPPLRIGVIGCGRLARAVHLPVLGRLPNARVVALAEPDETSRAAASAIARGASTYADAGDLLRAGGVDAVVICAPPQLHLPIATAAFDAGLHVYL
jgi:predicted dehydrogenase